MKIRFKSTFTNSLSKQVKYISIDSSSRAQKFNKEIIETIKLIEDNPFMGRKSIYFDDDNIRDLIFKGYSIIYRININKNTIDVFGFVKYQQYS
ncbi:MAG: type II toxin-antitoxin system RelE/ParE family toxin [Candidatus Kapaibacterium sp.]